jgi:hypothetical protein
MRVPFVVQTKNKRMIFHRVSVLFCTLCHLFLCSGKRARFMINGEPLKNRMQAALVFILIFLMPVDPNLYHQRGSQQTDD